MKQNYTDLTIILDSSGSMNAIAGATIDGFNRLVAEQQALPGEVTLTLVKFNDGYRAVLQAVPIRNVPALKPEDYRPDGGTALLDAVGRTIDETGRRLAALAEGDRPAQVIVAILTDGFENASRHYSRQQVAQRIGLQRDVYGWRFLFLGANQDAILEGAKLGIDGQSSLTFTASDAGSEAAFSSLSKSIDETRTSNGAGFGTTGRKQGPKNNNQ